ncbi:MAG: DsbA family protein [Acidobacteria bacterium]|nr:DsbA family protein [Acidobacteriota bacterium]
MTTSIDVFADIWCPFAHIGLRCAREQLDAAGRPDVVLRIRPWPLELVNSAPMDPDRTTAHIAHLRHQIDDTRFVGFRVETFPTSTIEPLALTERAYVVDPQVGEAMAFALREALFERGIDISDPEAIAALAAEHGIDPPGPEDREAVIASWHEGQARGVKGSPHFFCGDAEMFCPSLDITRPAEGEVIIDLDVDRLAGFLRACLD